MATTEAVLSPVARPEFARRHHRELAWLITPLTFLAVAIHGYHPYAEDAGVYLAGIQKILNPGLYPVWTGFVTAHLRFSLFAYIVAALVRVSHLGLMTVMFALYVTSVWATLYAGWEIARRITSDRAGCAGAVLFLSLMLTVPVAGTSLMLTDPYVTARSISMPFGLLAIARALDVLNALKCGGEFPLKSGILCATCLVIAGAAHPLMAGYTLACMVILACVVLEDSRTRMAVILAVSLLAIALAAGVERLGPAQSAEYAQVARTRNYWFLGTWQWYELFGLAAPLLVLIALACRRSERLKHAMRWLAMMALVAGCTSFVVALLFARESSSTFMVARLQPLRIYQVIYALMIVALGAFVGEVFLRARAWRWLALAAIVGVPMYLVQRWTFPSSQHVELPWQSPRNPWQQAFVWMRGHTPTDAVFALDANYILASGEDSQNVRAISERSTMPDYAKDGGIASIAPDLTPQWAAGEVLQQGLNKGITAARIKDLREHGVGWVVLTRNTPMSFACAYANEAVKVCPLPAQGLKELASGARPVAVSSR